MTALIQSALEALLSAALDGASPNAPVRREASRKIDIRESELLDSVAIDAMCVER